MMATEHAVDAIESFFELERRFESFINAVTFKSDHARVHSPVLAGLLLECGSLCESIFKSAMDNPRYNGIPNIANIRARRYNRAPPYYNINDSRAVFRSDQLYAKRVWFWPRSDSSFPWYAWRTRAVSHPKWWASYNSIKHDRFGNLQAGKLGTAMHAMQGTFLLLVQSLDYRGDLVALGVIRLAGLTIQELLSVTADWEPLPCEAVVVATSKLFAYKFKSRGYPENAADISALSLIHLPPGPLSVVPEPCTGARVRVMFGYAEPLEA